MGEASLPGLLKIVQHFAVVMMPKSMTFTPPKKRSSSSRWPTPQSVIMLLANVKLDRIQLPYRRLGNCADNQLGAQGG